MKLTKSDPALAADSLALAAEGDTIRQVFMPALALFAVVAAAVRSVVLQGAVALEPGQPAASVAVIMVDGVAENKGCTDGILYTGRFVISVWGPHVSRETDLNALLGVDTLSFPERSYLHVWPLEFADYNRDGHPDFSVADHSCHNLGFFTLLTIATDGRVSRLPVIPDGPLVSSYSGPSSPEITVTPEGIEVGGYDNSVGSGFRHLYRWSRERGAFVLVPPTSTKP